MKSIEIHLHAFGHKFSQLLFHKFQQQRNKNFNLLGIPSLILVYCCTINLEVYMHIWDIKSIFNLLSN